MVVDLNIINTKYQLIENVIVAHTFTVKGDPIVFNGHDTQKLPILQGPTFTILLKCNMMVDVVNNEIPSNSDLVNILLVQVKLLLYNSVLLCEGFFILRVN